MLDYAPERSKIVAGVDVAHGTIKSTYKDKTNTTRSAIEKRLNLFGSATPSCHRHELLLSLSAPDMLLDLDALITLYDQQLIHGQYDLLNVTTVRFGHEVPSHRQWEWARGWARSSFAIDRKAPVLLVHHLPSLAGRHNKPHIHAIHWARSLQCSRFGGFTDLAKPGARAILAAEWKAWIAAND